MSYRGMDPGVITQVADGMAHQAGSLESVTQHVDSLLQQVSVLWPGQDAHDFHQFWLGQHRPHLQSTVDGLKTAVTGLRAQIQAQVDVSGGTGAADADPTAASSVSLSGPGTETSADGPEFSYGNDHLIAGDDRPWQRGSSPDPKAELSLGGVSAAAYLAKLGGEVNGNHNGVDYRAKGDVKLGEVGADGSAGITKDGLKVSAGAHANAMSTHGETSATYGIAKVDAQADGSVGVDALLDASVGKEGVHAGGEAFVGGKISAQGGADIGGVGSKFTGEAWAGAGIGGDLDVGYHDGEFTFGGYAGAGLGVGGKLGAEITIDPAEVVNTGEDLVKGIGRLFR